jgi:hypothetical protein
MDRLYLEKAQPGGLFFVTSVGAVFTAHAGVDGTAVNAFVGAVAVNVNPGGCLKAAVAVRR